MENLQNKRQLSLASLLNNRPKSLRFNAPPRLMPRVPTRRRCGAPPHAFHIDHRHHMNLAWERQKKEEEELSRVKLDIEGRAKAVLPVRSLQHLELLLEAAGGRLTILALHSCSCGVCKDVLRSFEEISKESNSQKSRVLFLSHDIVDEFDSVSDIARYYAVKAVPKFLFFVDGALVRTVGMSDVRQFKVNRTDVEYAVRTEQNRVKAILWELLVKNAPSARR